MNSENSKTSDPHRLLPNISDKINLKRSDKYIALSNPVRSYTKKNVKMSYKISISNIPAPTLNGKFELTERSYSVSDIQDYFKHIIKNIKQ